MLNCQLSGVLIRPCPQAVKSKNVSPKNMLVNFSMAVLSYNIYYTKVWCFFSWGLKINYYFLALYG
jgi:hypothetical protein